MVPKGSRRIMGEGLGQRRGGWGEKGRSQGTQGSRARNGGLRTGKPWGSFHPKQPGKRPAVTAVGIPRAGKAQPGGDCQMESRNEELRGGQREGPDWGPSFSFCTRPCLQERPSPLRNLPLPLWQDGGGGRERKRPCCASAEGKRTSSFKEAKEGGGGPPWDLPCSQRPQPKPWGRKRGRNFHCNPELSPPRFCPLPSKVSP